MAYIENQLNGPKAALRLNGDWVIGNLPTIDREIAAVDERAPDKPVVIDATQMNMLDVSSAWRLAQWLQGWADQGAQIDLQNFSDTSLSLLRMVQKQSEAEQPKPKPSPGTIYNFFSGIGRGLYNLRSGAVDFLSFSGRAFVALLGVILRPKRVRGTSIVYHMYEVGVRAVPIVALMSFLVAIVTGYQGIVQLRQFGAEIYTIDLVSISMLREMAVLITAIMVAGRSGSAFTAEIGVMKTNEEVDALRTMGLDAFEILVLPRLIAIMLVLPLLTIVADAAAMLANYITAITLLNVGGGQFFERLQGISIRHFNIGLFKAPFFAFLIGMVGCLRGFQVKGAAEEVGKYTTRAVVDSIFMVITMDALFSIIFSKLGY